MNELDDTIRAAAGGAARATVAPPFGIVSRRVSVRRNRQVAGVAASVVVVLAGAVLALPGRGPEAVAPAAPSPAALKPLAELSGDPAALVALRDCLATRRTVQTQQGPPRVYHRAQAAPCLAALGYEAPAPGTGATLGTIVIVPDDWAGQVMTEGDTEATAGCWETPEPEGKDVRTLATGQLTGFRWYVVAWTGKDGARCVGFQMTPRGEPLTPESDLDSGPDGALRAFLAWDFFKEPDGSRPVVWWGAVSPEVARVEFVVGGKKQSFPTIDGGDRRYVALLLDVPKGARTTGPVGYDAQGRRVPLPES